MNDKEYRLRVMLESEYISHNVLILKHQSFNQYEKQLVWLQTLGLMETWDII